MDKMDLVQAFHQTFCHAASNYCREYAGITTWTTSLTGASDCATPVGVMLETARVFIADPDIKLTAPVIFLLNGAEETLSQAAHGFMTSHK